MFAQRLKDLRKKEGITQEALAVIIGVERSSVGKYESPSKPVMPSFDVLSAIADYFHVSVDYLLGRTDDPINYEDGDLIASLNDNILRENNYDVRKTVAVQRAIDEDAKNENPHDRITHNSNPNYEKELKFALFNNSDNITDEMFEKVKAFAKFIEQEEADKKK